MGSVLYSIVAFILGLGVLIAVHEFGHYWVARRLGVKVLRFSLGFGKPIWRTVRGVDQTEYVLSLVPLGGYVKMLDEREGVVDPKEVHRAFNRQSLSVRSAIVVAGPLFNFLFAILAYWMIFVMGVPGVKPVAGVIEPGSVLAQADLRENDEIIAVAGNKTPTLEVVRLELIDGALASQRVEMQVRRVDGLTQSLMVDLVDVDIDVMQESGVLSYLGFTPKRLHIPAVIDVVQPGGAADVAGFRPGDQVLYNDGQAVKGWMDWAEMIRSKPDQPMTVIVLRGNQQQTIEALPARFETKQGEIGRLGVSPYLTEELTASLRTIQSFSMGQALIESIGKTWDMSLLTLRMLWKMLLGEASLKNISGPITIADYAGQTAQIGLVAFLSFLAIVSISLGVLNLLPIPILDGGHLMYFIVELIKGTPVSESVQLFGQKVGILMLGGLMFIAFYNDIDRLLG